MIDFRKYHKIKIVGDADNEGIFSNPDDEIIIQEKLDGANFRFFINKGNIVFGSRTQQLTSDEGEDTNVHKNFTRCIKFVRETLEGVDLTPFNNCIFYGENMVKHTLDYNWEKIPPFLGFDVISLSAETGRYLDFKKTRDYFEKLGLPMVPLIKKCKASEIENVGEGSVPKSLYTEQLSEGIVFKNYKRQLFAKYVREKFKEKNRETFGGNKKHANTDEEWLTAVYCTNARIEKNLFKLIDEGEELAMTLMHKLPPKVYTDVWEENWEEIINLNKVCDFKNFKRKISGRCLNLLKQVITNNALQG